MAISHELSSEIATALFAAKESQQRSPGELRDLKDMVFKIHSTLEQLVEKPRKVHSRAQAAPTDNKGF